MFLSFFLVSCTSNYQKNINNTPPLTCYDIKEKEKSLALKYQRNAEEDYDDKWFWQKWGNSCPVPTFKSEMYIEECEDIYKQPMKFLSCKEGFSTKTGLGERLVWDSARCYYVCEEYCDFVAGTECKGRSVNNSKSNNKIGTMKESTTCRVTQVGTLSCSTVTYD